MRRDQSLTVRAAAACRLGGANPAMPTSACAPTIWPVDLSVSIS